MLNQHPSQVIVLWNQGVSMLLLNNEDNAAAWKNKRWSRVSQKADKAEITTGIKYVAGSAAHSMGPLLCSMR